MLLDYQELTIFLSARYYIINCAYICIAVMAKEILVARKKGRLSLKFFTSILNSVYSFIYTFFDLWIIELATTDWLLAWPLQEPLEAL